MLPKDQRLSQEELQHIKKTKASRSHSPLCMVERYTSIPGKVAIVVSKKVAKKAVERNRLRRSAYRCFMRKSLSASYIVYLKKESVAASQLEMCAALASCIE